MKTTTITIPKPKLRVAVVRKTTGFGFHPHKNEKRVGTRSSKTRKAISEFS
jgi:hypothetical protein